MIRVLIYVHHVRTSCVLNRPWNEKFDARLTQHLLLIQLVSCYYIRDILELVIRIYGYENKLNIVFISNIKAGTEVVEVAWFVLMSLIKFIRKTLCRNLSNEDTIRLA